jgi:hypothetical protein
MSTQFTEILGPKNSYTISDSEWGNESFFNKFYCIKNLMAPPFSNFGSKKRTTYSEL